MLVDVPQEPLLCERMQNTGFGALTDALRLLGSQTKLSKAIGVSPQAVSEVMRRGKSVPPAWCLKIEKATGGAVTAHALRPDLYPKGDDDGNNR
jgi:DNA-binding transcriptional regulator YdaS (Cro superfamily)